MRCSLEQILIQLGTDSDAIGGKNHVNKVEMAL